MNLSALIRLGKSVAVASSLSLLAAFATSPVLAANTIEILSSRPDKVSGGNALVQINVDSAAAVVVTLNGVDVSASFFPDGEDRLLGYVTGLANGKNRLEVLRLRPGGKHAKHVPVAKDALTITNHPIHGPVFSGPQEQPYYCQTHQFRVYPNGPFLTTAQIVDPCTVLTRVDYLYRTTINTFAAFDPALPWPADLAMTTTNEGRTVPYIVRLETGTINRAIYQTAILDDPRIIGPDIRNHADPGWNGRLVYTFGGGCSSGQYRQGSTTGGVLEESMLSKGFAVASASLNVLGNNCNHVISAETVMMVKERFIEAYGLPRYTIGWGCSGGAVQQYMVTDSYPGLLDGIVPQCSFPDLFQAVVADSRLLLNYFLNAPAVPWTQEEIRLASGFGTFGQLPAQGRNNALRMEAVPTRPGWPNAAWNAIIPTDVRYDPVVNPTGIRPTFYDHHVNIFGRDDQGFARRPLDNVGVQYGLGALNAGQITKDQFLDLNERIGGFDIDFNFIPQRTVANRRATRAAYETGSVLNGGGGLAAVPILDMDVIYTDFAPNGDVHSKFHHFSTRERIRKANGHAGNMVMWSGVFGPRQAVAASAGLDAMDAWLASLAADSSRDPLPARIVRNKPASLTDGCWTGDAVPQFVAEQQFLGGQGTSFCNSLYPAASYPLRVAGAPLANDIVKCRLREFAWSEYAVSFTPEEKARLHNIFPEGVCDWRRPGVGQRDLLGPWIEYKGVGRYQPDRRAARHGEHDRNDD